MTFHQKDKGLVIPMIANVHHLVIKIHMFMTCKCSHHKQKDDIV